MMRELFSGSGPLAGAAIALRGYHVRTLVGGLFAVLLLMVSACSNEPGPPTSTSPATQTGQAGQNSPASSPGTQKPPMAGGGDAIDTTKLDAGVKQAEAEQAKKPDDATTRTALAHAYLARAGALTKARQYRAALGDYRRTLKFDPKNEEAKQMSDQIVGIMQSMGREVPKEGEEPAPLPMPTKANP